MRVSVTCLLNLNVVFIRSLTYCRNFPIRGNLVRSAIINIYDFLLQVVGAFCQTGLVVASLSNGALSYISLIVIIMYK